MRRMMDISTSASVDSAQSDSVVIKLSDDTIEKLFREAFDGWCPVCLQNQVNLGESICCECAAEALTYHKNTCGCIVR